MQAAYAYILKRVLGEYLVNSELNSDQVDVGLSAGQLVLYNLELNVTTINSALLSHDAPFEVSPGAMIDRVSLSIPWMSMFSKSCRVEITGLSVELIPRVSTSEEQEEMSESIILDILKDLKQLSPEEFLVAQDRVNTSLCIAETETDEMFYDVDTHSESKSSCNFMKVHLENIIRNLEVEVSDLRIASNDIVFSVDKVTISNDDGESTWLKVCRIKKISVLAGPTVVASTDGRDTLLRLSMERVELLVDSILVSGGIDEVSRFRDLISTWASHLDSENSKRLDRGRQQFNRWMPRSTSSARPVNRSGYSLEDIDLNSDRPVIWEIDVPKDTCTSDVLWTLLLDIQTVTVSICLDPVTSLGLTFVEISGNIKKTPECSNIFLQVLDLTMACGSTVVLPQRTADKDPWLMFKSVIYCCDQHPATSTLSILPDINIFLPMSLLCAALDFVRGLETPSVPKSFPHNDWDTEEFILTDNASVFVGGSFNEILQRTLITVPSITVQVGFQPESSIHDLFVKATDLSFVQEIRQGVRAFCWNVSISGITLGYLCTRTLPKTLIHVGLTESVSIKITDRCPSLFPEVPDCFTFSHSFWKTKTNFRDLSARESFIEKCSKNSPILIDIMIPQLVVVLDTDDFYVFEVIQEIVSPISMSPIVAPETLVDQYYTKSTLTMCIMVDLPSIRCIISDIPINPGTRPQSFMLELNRTEVHRVTGTSYDSHQLLSIKEAMFWEFNSVLESDTTVNIFDSISMSPRVLLFESSIDIFNKQQCVGTNAVKRSESILILRDLNVFLLPDTRAPTKLSRLLKYVSKDNSSNADISSPPFHTCISIFLDNSSCIYNPDVVASKCRVQFDGIHMWCSFGSELKPVIHTNIQCVSGNIHKECLKSQFKPAVNLRCPEDNSTGLTMLKLDTVDLVVYPEDNIYEVDFGILSLRGCSDSCQTMVEFLTHVVEAFNEHFSYDENSVDIVQDRTASIISATTTTLRPSGDTLPNKHINNSGQKRRATRRVRVIDEYDRSPIKKSTTSPIKQGEEHASWNVTDVNSLILEEFYTVSHGDQARLSLPAALDKPVLTLVLKNLDISLRLCTGTDWGCPQPSTAVNAEYADVLYYLEGDEVHKTESINSESSQPNSDNDEAEGIDVRLTGIIARIDIFNPQSRIATRVAALVREIEVIDQMEGSHFTRMVGRYRRQDKPQWKREFMAEVELLSVRTPGRKNLSKNIEDLAQRLVVVLCPIRINIDQRTVFFLESFAQDVLLPIKSGDTSVDSPIAHIEKLSIANFVLSIDYRPRRVDYSQLKEGDFAQLVHMFPITNLVFDMKRLLFKGVSGWDEAFNLMVEQWTKDISENQGQRYLAGIKPIRSLVNISSGISDIVLVPYSQYRKDGDIVRGLATGTANAIKPVVMESMDLLSFLVGAANGAAEAVDTAFYPVKRTVRKKRSRRPRGILNGLSHAYAILSSEMVNAAGNIIVVPANQYQNSGSIAALRSAVTGIPRAVVCSTIAITKAASTAISSATNTLDPQRKIDRVDKYRK